MTRSIPPKMKSPRNRNKKFLVISVNANFRNQALNIGVILTFLSGEVPKHLSEFLLPLTPTELDDVADRLANPSRIFVIA